MRYDQSNNNILRMDFTTTNSYTSVAQRQVWSSRHVPNMKRLELVMPSHSILLKFSFLMWKMGKAAPRRAVRIKWNRHAKVTVNYKIYVFQDTLT